MIGTVLRYEIKRTLPLLGQILLVSLVLCALGVVMVWLEPNLEVFAMLSSTLACTVACYGTPIYLAIDYRRINFSEQGYFTHTLPVGSRTLFWTKFGWLAAQWLFGIILTGLLLLPLSVIAFTAEYGDIGRGFEMVSQTISQTLAGDELGYYLLLGLFLYILTLYFGVMLILAVTLAHEQRFQNSRLFGNPILLLIGMWVITPLIIGAGALIPLELRSVNSGPLTLEAFNPFDIAGTSHGVAIGPFLMVLVLLGVFIWRISFSWTRRKALT